MERPSAGREGGESQAASSSNLAGGEVATAGAMAFLWGVLALVEHGLEWGTLIRLWACVLEATDASAWCRVKIHGKKRANGGFGWGRLECALKETRQQSIN